MRSIKVTCARSTKRGRSRAKAHTSDGIRPHLRRCRNQIDEDFCDSEFADLFSVKLNACYSCKACCSASDASKGDNNDHQMDSVTTEIVDSCQSYPAAPVRMTEGYTREDSIDPRVSAFCDSCKGIGAECGRMCHMMGTACITSKYGVINGTCYDCGSCCW